MTAGRWDRNADFWIKIIREGLDPFRSQLTDAAVLDAVGPTTGKAVLDAGCGEGYLARALSAAGARVSGVDRSPVLVAAAADACGDGSFTNGDLEALPYRDASFDVVVCNHIVNDLDDPEGPFRELARVLKPGGKLVVLMLHPCFYGGRDESGGREAVSAERYFSRRRIEQRFSVSGLASPAANVIWVLPLETYVSLLVRSGLVLTGLSEPHPPEQLLARDAWWAANFQCPLFLIMVAEKPLAARLHRDRG